VPSRTVHAEDALGWLAKNPLAGSHAVITSLPDSSEVPKLGFDGWRQWFIDTSTLLCRAVADDAVAIFFQTDVKLNGGWVDKGHLVHCGADAAASKLLWHKVVCRAPPGITTFGRPAYAHLLCFSRGLKLEKGQSSPDVLERLGEMTWARAMGVEACVAACKFVLERTACRTIVDPFCGLGTALAVANAMGMDSVGVELSAKRAEKAKTLEVRLPRK
jgi:hypothetical protein